jgi:ribonuclease P protein subunit POP4
MQRDKNARIALIGRPIEVVRSSNPGAAGMRGKAIDETRNTITIETEKGTKTIIKDQSEIKTREKTINGKMLIGRTHERIKQ